ncbi:hypothetical protein BD779DRAFT_1676158 [Infundibulicybe gibba]|nr:hypothetical protein BD779DRAFT_1676158 [Infundibulicybe gibba]
MSSTASPMPTVSSYFDDHGALSPSQALAWKFYAFGMLAIFVTGILATVIYLGCFRLRRPGAPLGDIETNEATVTGTKTVSLDAHGNLAESCDESVSTTFPLSPSTTTLVSPPPKAYTAARGDGSPCDPRGLMLGRITQCPHLPASHKILSTTDSELPIIWQLRCAPAPGLHKHCRHGAICA